MGNFQQPPFDPYKCAEFVTERVSDERYAELVDLAERVNTKPPRRDITTQQANQWRDAVRSRVARSARRDRVMT